MNLYTITKLNSQGVSVVDAVHPRTKKLCSTVYIDNQWIVEQRALHNNSLTAGDIVHEVFTALFGYKSVAYWCGVQISIGDSEGIPVEDASGEVVGILYYFNQQMVFNKK